MVKAKGERDRDDRRTSSKDAMFARRCRQISYSSAATPRDGTQRSFEERAFSRPDIPKGSEGVRNRWMGSANWIAMFARRGDVASSATTVQLLRREIHNVVSKSVFDETRYSEGVRKGCAIEVFSD